MALADDIRALRVRAVGELTQAHDYYAESVAVWRGIAKDLAAGRRFHEQNPATGTVTTEADLLAKVEGYVTVQLAESSFVQFLTIFESFVFDLLRLWLLAHPRSLGARKIDFRDVLDAADTDAVAEQVVRREINEVMYERPAGWFAYLDAKVSLGGRPTPDQIARITEAKASRDLLLHNRGVVNAMYTQKAGPLARYPDGLRIEVPEPYHRAVWELTLAVVADVCDAVSAKVGPTP